MKRVIFIGLFSILVNAAYSQEKIYFLADTINVSKENQVLMLGNLDNVFDYHFIFYCKCAPPYKTNVTFSYTTKKGEKKPEIISEKPNYSYISFKQLMEIAGKYHRYFDDSYELYITEALPNNKYRTSKVKFVPYQPPIDDTVKVPSNK